MAKKPARKSPAKKKPSTALVRQQPAGVTPIPNLPLGPPLVPEVGQFVQLSALTSTPAMSVQFVGTLHPTETQKKALRRPVADEEVEWRPAKTDGPPEIPYLSHNGYRDRLDDAFGLGGWGMAQTALHQEKDGLVVAPYALVIGGYPRVFAWGEQKYHANNSQMSLGDAMEGAKSNAIVRCGKELGIARELWSKGYIAALKKRVPVSARIAGYEPEPRTQPSRQTGNPPRPLPKQPGQNAAGGDYITEGQLKRFWVILRNSGRSEDSVRDWLKQMGVESTREIRRDQYDDFCKAIEAPGPLWTTKEDREPGEDDQ